jgi:hypothetical protein
MSSATLSRFALAIAVVAAAGGCAPSDHKAMAAADAKAGLHEATAPHGGKLVAVGDEDAHFELLVDSATGTLTAYVLDGEAEEFVRLKNTALDVDLTIPDAADTTRAPKKVSVHLVGIPNKLTGETAQETSEYQGQDGALRGVRRFSGKFRPVTLLGNVYDDVAFTYP